MREASRYPQTYRLTSKGPFVLRHLLKRRPVGPQLAYTCRMRIITYRDFRPGRFTKPLERLRARGLVLRRTSPPPG